MENKEFLKKILTSDINSSDLKLMTEFLMDRRILFGHSKKIRHHSMSKYIICSKNEIDIFNPYIVILSLQRAFKNLLDIKNIIIIFSNKMTDRGSVNEIIDLASNFNVNYICFKWLGGTLTNVSNTISSINKIDTFKSQLSLETKNIKRTFGIENKLKKITKNLSGLKNIKNNMPDAIFSFSAKNDIIALAEAKKLGIKTFAVCDSNTDSSYVDFPLIGNDDIRFSIKLFIDFLREALLKINEKIKLSNTERIKSKK